MDRLREYRSYWARLYLAERDSADDGDVELIVARQRLMQIAYYDDEDTYYDLNNDDDGSSDRVSDVRLRVYAERLANLPPIHHSTTRLTLGRPLSHDATEPEAEPMIMHPTLRWLGGVESVATYWVKVVEAPSHDNVATHSTIWPQSGAAASSEQAYYWNPESDRTQWEVPADGFRETIFAVAQSRADAVA